VASIQWKAKREALEALPAPAVRRALRQAAGLSQADVATAVGAHKSAISRWEAGTSAPHGDLWS
jgi:DNA-binding transcriptional regulator YiaG